MAVDCVRVPFPRSQEGAGQVVSFIEFPKRQNNPRLYNSRVRPVYIGGKINVNVVANDSPCPSSNPRPHLMLKIGDADNAPSVKALFDTGASISIMTMDTLRQLQREAP